MDIIYKTQLQVYKEHIECASKVKQTLYRLGAAFRVPED